MLQRSKQVWSQVSECLPSSHSSRPRPSALLPHAEPHIPAAGGSFTLAPQTAKNMLTLRQKPPKNPVQATRVIQLFRAWRVSFPTNRCFRKRKVSHARVTSGERRKHHVCVRARACVYLVHSDKIFILGVFWGRFGCRERNGKRQEVPEQFPGFYHITGICFNIRKNIYWWNSEN